MSTITYRRNLPHIHPENTPIFITFQLANSLPIDVLEQLKRELDAELEKIFSNEGRYNVDKIHFARYDEWLGRIETTPRWLQQEKIAQIVQEKLPKLEKEHYHLFAYCIMPNPTMSTCSSNLDWAKNFPKAG